MLESTFAIPGRVEDINPEPRGGRSERPVVGPPMSERTPESWNTPAGFGYDLPPTSLIGDAPVARLSETPAEPPQSRTEW